MRLIICMLVLASLLVGCGNNSSGGDQKKQAIEAIQKAEADFAKMAAEKGIAEAFWFYADSNAVIKRERDTLIHGRDAIRNYYSAAHYTGATVTWSPDFTDASDQGDVGYTYGKYNWQAKDSTGNVTEFKGVFHTVWKKQPDGSWKYVWD